MTGIPAPTSARARSTEVPPRSIFTASQPASLTNRCALLMASSLEASYDPNGMSPIISGVVSPRRTAWASMSSSSSVTGTVDGYPSTVIAPESPTSTTSTPASSATWRGRKVVGRDHHDRLTERLLLGRGCVRLMAGRWVGR